MIRITSNYVNSIAIRLYLKFELILKLVTANDLIYITKTHFRTKKIDTQIVIIA